MNEEKSVPLRLAVIENMTALASAGLGLVAALAWNDAIQGLFRELFGSASGLIAKFVYAVVITMIVVFVTVKLSRAADRLRSLIGSEDKKE